MLRKKCAVITGASEGIGFAIAKAFAKNGANLCLVSRDHQKLSKAKTTLSKYGVDIHVVAGDLGIPENVSKISREIHSYFSEIDILVNNAGIGRFIPFDETNLEALDMHINLNIKAPYLLTQQLLKSLVKSNGNIINISSYFAHRMLPGRDSTAYSLTKGAINSFTKSLAFEMGKRGVRVNAIAPGSINTPQLNLNLEKLSSEGKKKFQEMIEIIYPLGKIGEAEDIAHAAVYLASEDAKWVTGSIMSVDGGLTTN